MVRLKVRVDTSRPPPLTVSKEKKSRPLIMNVYGLKRILTKGNFFTIFDYFGLFSRGFPNREARVCQKEMTNSV